LLTDFTCPRQPVRFVVSAAGRAGLPVAVDRRPRLAVVDSPARDLETEAFVAALRRRGPPPGAPVVVLPRDGTRGGRAPATSAGAGGSVSGPFACARIERALGVALEVCTWR
jgi:hypothetical protein